MGSELYNSLMKKAKTLTETTAEAVRQSDKQSDGHSDNQSGNQSGNQSDGQSIKQSGKQSIGQSDKHSGKQSIKHSDKQANKQPDGHLDKQSSKLSDSQPPLCFLSLSQKKVYDYLVGNESRITRMKDIEKAISVPYGTIRGAMQALIRERLISKPKRYRRGMYQGFTYVVRKLKG